MADRGNGYRDELSAAHARIAELEEQVEVLARRAEGLSENETPEEIEARLLELRQRREDLRKVSRTHPWLLLPIVLAALLFGGAMWILGLSLPVLAFLVLAGFMFLRNWVIERAQYRTKIDVLDEQMAKLSRVPESERVRNRSQFVAEGRDGRAR